MKNLQLQTFGTNYDNLQTNIVYATNTNETWLYEQPQTIHVATRCVNFIEVLMPLKTQLVTQGI